MYIVLGIIAFFLALMFGWLVVMFLALAYTGSSFLGLLLFPPLMICLMSTGGRLSECTLGYIETDGSSWAYDTIFKPIFGSFNSTI